MDLARNEHSVNLIVNLCPLEMVIEMERLEEIIFFLIEESCLFEYAHLGKQY